MADTVEYKQKPLKEVLEGLKDNQKDFLCLTIQGVSDSQAMELVGNKLPTLYAWRKYDQDFQRAEEAISLNDYRKEAVECYSSHIAGVSYGLLKLASRINEWGKLDAIDKPYVFKASELVGKIYGGNGKRESPDSYDELILKKHRKLKGG